ncbi:MAG: adenylosuccinate synthase [Chlamydiia bacterium]|nr:adenylosuccinate synthase [Chlamydiia bacterium]
MNTVAVVGLQWGDEGKGKVVDLLSLEMDGVIRSQGGHNAGHTIVVEGKEYHFHLIPSAILHPHVKCYIGGGTVVDPRSLLNEIEGLQKEGISLKNRLFISPYAHLILPYHQLQEQIQEEGASPIGTTRRGIGPCYEDSVARMGIQLGEWVDIPVFKKRFSECSERKKRFLESMGVSSFDSKAIYEEYATFANFLKEYITPFENLIYEELKKGKKFLFEGAQGAMLDVRFGTYPYVTSSCTASGGLAVGAGLGPQSISKTLGVMKAYSTRVGNGPFPTEFSSKEMASFASHHQAREFGTTTGRKRRMGWLDIPLLKEAIRLDGVTSLAITKVDVLDHLERMKVCVDYEGGSYPSFYQGDIGRVKPVYKEFEGWKKSTKEIKKLEEFPKNVRIFLNQIETLLDCPIELVSFGPEREKTLRLS